MLQHLISFFAPPLSNQTQPYPEALLSAKVEYNNEHVTELESMNGKQTIPEIWLHLLIDTLTNGQ
jgi:hypothetical protein